MGQNENPLRRDPHQSNSETPENCDSHASSEAGSIIVPSGHCPVLYSFFYGNEGPYEGSEAVSK